MHNSSDSDMSFPSPSNETSDFSETTPVSPSSTTSSDYSSEFGGFTGSSETENFSSSTTNDNNSSIPTPSPPEEYQPEAKSVSSPKEIPPTFSKETTGETIEKAQTVLADPYAQPQQIQNTIDELKNSEQKEESKQQLPRIITDLSIKLIQQQPLAEAKKIAKEVITKLLQQNSQITTDDLEIQN